MGGVEREWKNKQTFIDSKGECASPLLVRVVHYNKTQVIPKGTNYAQLLTLVRVEQ